MTGPKHWIASSALGWALLVATSAISLAQAPSTTTREPAYTTQQPGVSQSTTAPGSGKPPLSVLGIPTKIRAPVAKPYTNNATHIHGGQPMKSGTSLIAPPTERAQ